MCFCCSVFQYEENSSVYINETNTQHKKIKSYASDSSDNRCTNKQKLFSFQVETLIIILSEKQHVFYVVACLVCSSFLRCILIGYVPLSLREIEYGNANAVVAVVLSLSLKSGTVCVFRSLRIVCFDS